MFKKLNDPNNKTKETKKGRFRVPLDPEHNQKQTKEKQEGLGSGEVAPWATLIYAMPSKPTLTSRKQKQKQNKNKGSVEWEGSKFGPPPHVKRSKLKQNDPQNKKNWKDTNVLGTFETVPDT